MLNRMFLLLLAAAQGKAAAIGTFDIKVGSNAQVTFTATGPMQFIGIQTPLLNPQCDCFVFDDSSVQFTGPDILFATKDDNVLAGSQSGNDFLIDLSAGESKSINIDLSKIYNLESGKDYIVKFQHFVGIYLNKEAAGIAEFSSNEVTVVAQTEPEGRSLRLHDTQNELAESVFERELIRLGRVIFTNCTKSERKTIEEAMKYSFLNIRDHVMPCLTRGTFETDETTGEKGYVHPGNLCIQKYQEMFGSGTATRDSIIHLRQVFKRVKRAVKKSGKKEKSVEMVCNAPDCYGGGSIFAFVTNPDANSTTSYRIHMCPVFFAADLLTRGRTIIHEFTHFQDIGQPAMFDYCIGDQFCRFLATVRPDLALISADSVGIYGALTCFDETCVPEP